MRIAMVAPPWYEVPPPAYGGIETVVAGLVDQLVVAGHDVTLIGAGTNGTKASRFTAIWDEAPSHRIGEPVPELLYAAAVADALEGLDVEIVHDHSLAGPLLAASRPVPTVVTMHGPVRSEHGDYLALLGDAVHVVAISDAQRTARPELSWAGRVHNAVDVSAFPFAEHKNDFVLWVGRFNEQKAPRLAVEAAQAAGVPIILAGKCTEPAEQAHFEREIRPLLGRGVTYVGEADATLKRQLYAAARALVFPIQWDEPFGMVMVEAMACGTPVIATRRGSVPEIVVDGVTGRLVDAGRDISQFAVAISDALALSPLACRHHVEQHFDLPVMARGYEDVYSLVTARSRGVRPPGTVAAGVHGADLRSSVRGARLTGVSASTNATSRWAGAGSTPA